jgi:predicted XRE-type DNA-binding protein
MSQITEIVNGLLKTGLTQTEIARRTGIPQSRISRWAHAKTLGSSNDVLALVEFAKRREAELQKQPEAA